MHFSHESLQLKSNEGVSIEPLSRTGVIILRVMLTSLVVLVGMTTLEAVRQLTLPNSSLWEAQSLTVISVALVATVLAYFALRQYRQVMQELGKWQNEVETKNTKLLEANIALQSAVEQRVRAEEALREAQRDLENRVQERTAELTRANAALQAEVAQRQKTEESNRFQAQILSHVQDAVNVVDNQRRIVYWNNGAERLYGVKPEEVLGKTLADIYEYHWPRPEDEAAARQALQSAGWRHEECIHRLKRSGEEIYVESLISVLRDENGAPGGHLAVIRDITARKRTEDELRQAKEEAERANEAKSEFLSRMSHELRTPMNSILGFAQILEIGDLQTKQREAVDYILQAGRHLLNLINEVLDIARVESGGMQLALEPVNVTTLLQSVLDMVQPLATQRRQQIISHGTQAAHSEVQADPQRLTQVFLNLLSNAIKYNHEGGSVTVDYSKPAAGRLRIQVKDTGPGISPEKLERLFTPFDRLGAERSDVQGTGLGLALSRRLIEAMGGTVGVESTTGQGSTFWVELNLANASPGDHETIQDQTETVAETLSALFGKGRKTAKVPALKPAVPSFAGQETPNGRQVAVFSEDVLEILPVSTLPIPAQRVGRTVLYIEDNVANLRVIEHILENRPHIKLLSTMQGGLGLELAREHNPDLILLDLHLPDFHGSEVLRRLQADARTQDIPVVVVSADAISSQIEQMRAAGAREYLTKPLDIRRFLEVVDEVVSSGAGVGASTAR